MRSFRTVFTFLILPFLATSQITGYGLIDGLYGFELNLVQNEHEFMEGTIQYDLESDPQIVVAMLEGDTLRCQEMDAYLNPTVSLILIKSGDYFKGEWHDIERNQALPVNFYQGRSTIEIEQYARRYEQRWKDPEPYQVLFELSLSPTVSLGKFISEDLDEILDYSSNTVFNSTVYYTRNGPLLLHTPSTPEEQVVQLNKNYIESEYTLEALIPDFGAEFTGRLEEALEKWSSQIKTSEQVEVASRFPVRYYAICDLDYWSEDWVSGSFEFVGPGEVMEGFTFIFDREEREFVTFGDLIKSGNAEEIYNQLSEIDLGVSFDYFGLIFKGRFNPMTERPSRHLSWNALDVKLKRKLNDIDD